MAAITHKYIPANGDDCNAIRIDMDYSLGGMNYWNGNVDHRGYYLYCSPVVRETRTFRGEEYEVFSEIIGRGGKILLKEVTRRSKKAEEEAKRLAAEKESYLLAQICNRYGITLA